MKGLSEKENLLKPPKIGEIIEGKIIGKGKGAIFLDLGALGTGIIYGKEFFEAKENLKDLKIGEKILAKIINLENEEGYIELSTTQASKEMAWQTLKEKRERNETLKVKILGANKGGLLVEIFGIPGFIPVSQLSSANYPRVENGDSSKILKELQKFVGRELEVKIFDISQKEEKLILSERAGEAERIKDVFKKYKVGDIVEGKITAILDFGAFFKFGKENLEGLIHISELDWQMIEDPTQVVKIGQELKAGIIKISGDKIFLSLKALKKDPWLNIEGKYKKGDIIKGKVIKFNPFGAFVEIEPKIQGLIHISEFGSLKKMTEILEVGKKYNFKILAITPTEHKMNLKLVK